MKKYLTPTFFAINFSETDVVLSSSTLTAGDDNYKGDSLTADDWRGGYNG